MYITAYDGHEAFLDTHLDPTTGTNLCWYGDGTRWPHCNRRAAVHFLTNIPRRPDLAGDIMSCSEHFLDEPTCDTCAEHHTVVVQAHPYTPACSTGYRYHPTTDAWVCPGGRP